MCQRNPLHCILPPYIVENMLKSVDELVRKIASDNLLLAAEFRAARAILSGMPMFGAMASPTAKKHRLIYDMKHGPSFLLPGTLVRSEGDPKHTDPAVNEAYDHSGTTYDFYKKILKRNSLDGNGMQLLSSVHLGNKFNNAFWNGQQMAYGDGDGVIFNRFTKSLDVVGHELTHGVVTHTCNLIYQNESGALNEHFADVFGSLVKQWKKKQTVAKANWLIGEDIMVPKPTRRALRDMANPGTAYKNDPDLGSDPQPAHMSKKFTGTADHGGVHINSGIPNRAFYLAAQAIGGKAWETTGQIWYKALEQLTSTSVFADCAKITHQIAGADYSASAQKAVKDAWAAVGITV